MKSGTPRANFLCTMLIPLDQQRSNVGSTLTHAGDGMFLCGQPRPLSQGTQRSHFFHNTLGTLCPRTTKFGMVTHLAERHAVGSMAPQINGRGTITPKFLYPFAANHLVRKFSAFEYSLFNVVNRWDTPTDYRRSQVYRPHKCRLSAS